MTVTKNDQLPYLESIFISVFKPCNCSQLYFICNFGVASDFSSRTIFHGRHFSQLVEGWTFGGAVSLSTLYTLIHFHKFCLVRISPLDKMGDVKTYRWLYCLADAQNCQCERIVYFSIFCQFWRILWTLLKFALTVDQNVLPKRIYINDM